MRVLITGINGFLGKNLIRKLKNYELFGLGTKNQIIESTQVFNSNNLDELDLDIDIVIMCHAAVASGNDVLANKKLFEVNVLLTEKIVNKFNDAFIVYISTVSIYDINLEVILEKSKINPQSNYALSKLWAEMVVNSNIKSTILRLSSMYGIGMKQNTIIPNYVRQALENGVIEVWGEGKRIQNYVHVEDVISYIKKIINLKEKLYGKLVLGISKHHYSNLEIAQMIAKITNSKINFINDDDSKSFYYNNTFTTDLLNWRPNENIEERLQNYIKEWK